MSALTHLIDKFFPHQIDEKVLLCSVCPKISFKKAGEVGWGIVTFLLFLAMGPFSAVAVVLGVASLVPKGDHHMEPESAN